MKLEKLFKITEIYGGDNHIIVTSIINILWTFTCGYKFNRDDPKLQRLLNLLERRAKVFDMSGGVLNHAPWLRFIAPESTGFNLISTLNKEFYDLFKGVIEEHLNDYCEEKAGNDFIYAFLKEMKAQENNPNTRFTIKQLIMVIVDIFIAGATTTSTTIELALMSMLLYPDVQQKCREEIEKFEEISYTDRDSLPYTVATLLETQRCFPIFPILGLRRVLVDCKFHSYEIPKSATILVDSKGILEDKDFWKDPENFRPERFLDDNYEINQTLQER